MGFVQVIWASVVLVINVNALEFRSDTYFGNQVICNNISANPFFDVDMIIGKPWRVYFAWNIDLNKKCLDVKIKNATERIVRRIWNDMNEYLESQPNWEAATLLVSMGRENHEMLLFADQGPAGSFVGVPNIKREGNLSLYRNAVPLLSLQLKLLHHGKYLLMMDCHTAIGTLCSRRDDVPYRAEIASVAASLPIGTGFPACVNDKNNNEIMKLI